MNVNAKKGNTKKVALSPEDIDAAKKRLRIHDSDVGSSGVQIADLTGRILNLTRHMSGHHGDKHSRYGLVKLVSRRRKLLGHLKATDPKRHADTLAALNLRK